MRIYSVGKGSAVSAMERLRKEGSALAYRSVKQHSEPVGRSPCPSCQTASAFGLQGVSVKFGGLRLGLG